MTKVERFNEMLNKYAFTEDEQAFIKNEIALITKRNARKSTKPTKAQVANIAVKENIAKTLAEVGEPITAKGIGDILGLTPQKISALLKQMIASGEVVKEVVKGKSLFRLA